jgi:hypothetical protein
MIKNVIFLFFLSLLSVSIAQPTIQILGQSSNSLQLKIDFPDHQIIDVENQKPIATSSYLYMEGLSLLEEAGYPRIPYLTKMFSLPASQVSYKILVQKTEAIPVAGYLINNAIDPVAQQVATAGIKNKSMIDISAHGLFRDVPVFTLTVFPVSVAADGKTTTLVRSLTIEITSAKTANKNEITAASYSLKDRAVLDKLLLNGGQVSYKKDQTLQKNIITQQRYRPGRYKLLINETGLYKITYTDMIAAEIPVEQLDTRKLRLTNRGQEIPVYFKGGEDGVFDPGDYFEFWGVKNAKTFVKKYPDVYSDPFTDVNVYWLEQGSSSGLRMAEESGALTVSNPSQFIVPFAYTEKLHFEENNSFHRFGTANIDSLNYTMDHWYFDRGVTAVGSRTYTAHIPWPFNLGTRTVYVKAMMRGLSIKSDANPLENHRVEIWLNDRLAASSGSWKEQELHVLTNEGGTGLSQTDISHGENLFRVVMDQTGVTDITLLNWFDITYERRYRADQNTIVFRKQENLPENFVLQFEVDGFDSPDIDLYKVGVSKIVNSRIKYTTADDEVSSYQIAFQDEIFYPDIEYIALTESNKKKPMDILIDTPWLPDNEQASLLDGTNSADYLIVTDNLFYQNCLELKSYREGFGLNVEIVRVEDIYDEFNDGIKSPLAIKEFLAYAYENWDPNHRLLYVNLVGDASYNYKDGDFVPTFLFETEKYGAAASDFQYALVSGKDNTPDLIVGRIPISNNSEFTAYFDKLRAYEDIGNLGEWRNRGLFISGNDAGTIEKFPPYAPAFRAQNQRIIDFKAPDGYFTRKLNTVEDVSIPGGDPNFGSTPTLIDYFDEGVALINFYGHGGGGIWADVGLFNSNDIERLNNGSRLPFIKSMTCFTGAFESASINGIAEQLIVTPEKGAIGLLAASGVGWLHNDFAVGWTLTEFLLEHDMTMGEAVLFTKIFYLNNNVYVAEEFDNTIPSYHNLKLSMVNHYNLFGDPYVSISKTEDVLNLSVDNKIPSVGDTITVTVEIPFPSGNGRIELCNENHEPLEDKFLVFNGSQTEVVFEIPEQLENQLAYVKAYAINSAGDQDGRGVVNLAINKAMLDSVVTSPKKPSIGDEIYFSAHISSPIAVQRVRIKHLKGPSGHYEDITLEKITDSLWETLSGFGPYLFADTLFFDVQMDDTAGMSYVSRQNRLVITDPRPDLLIVPNSLSFGGTEQIALSMVIENNSDTVLTQVDTRFYADSLGGAQEPIHQAQTSLNPQPKKEISFVVDQALLQNEREFFAVLDWQNMIEERNEENNFQQVVFPGNLFNIPQLLGTTNDGLSNDTLELDQSVRFHLPPQALSASSVLSYNVQETNDLLSLEEQPGLTYVSLYGQTSPAYISLRFNNPAAEQIKNAILEFRVDTTAHSRHELATISICRFVPSINRWVGMNTYQTNDRLVASVDQVGDYALFKIEDVKKPVVEITVNGRILHDNMLVPLNPSLAFIIQDENGIDLTSGFNVYIDDQKLTTEELNVPDTVQNANAVALTAKPKLTAGEHTIRTEVADAFGNTLEKTLSFQVSESFELQIFGNYPNPFEDFTVISFLVLANNVLDDFSIKIYTVAGRQIREIRNPQGSDEIWDPGYHEVEWDGRDQDGKLVANGVYFALIKANLGDQSFEETMKIAKLK